MIRPKVIALLSVLILLPMILTCSRTAEQELPENGFGYLDQTLSAGVNQIQFFLTTTEAVKGVEFFLAWDPQQARVDLPKLLSGHDKFVIHARKHDAASMKVLIFSMESLVFDSSKPWLFELPLEPILSTGEIKLDIQKTIFAGSNSAQFNIPTLTGTLKIGS